MHDGHDQQALAEAPPGTRPEPLGSGGLPGAGRLRRPLRALARAPAQHARARRADFGGRDLHAPGAKAIHV